MFAPQPTAQARKKKRLACKHVFAAYSVPKNPGETHSTPIFQKTFTNACL